MRFSAAKSILRSFLRDAPGVVLRVEPGVIEAARLLRIDVEVSTWHWIQLRYVDKSTHTYVDAGFRLQAPRLSTHPVDAEFLELAADMSARMKEEVIALRRRLNGNVPYQVPGLLAPEEQLLNHHGPIDDWSEEAFLLYLLQVCAQAEHISSMPAPARTAEELLAWCRAGAEQSIGKAIMQRWSVASAA